MLKCFFFLMNLNKNWIYTKINIIAIWLCLSNQRLNKFALLIFELFSIDILFYFYSFTVLPKLFELFVGWLFGFCFSFVSLLGVFWKHDLSSINDKMLQKRKPTKTISLKLKMYSNLDFVLIWKRNANCNILVKDIIIF